MQCKDIPDLPILRWLDQTKDWATWIRIDPPGTQHMPCVLNAMPAGVPPKLARAKMARLIERDLVYGCPCGCRGDYTITDKGRAFIQLADKEMIE